MVAAGPAGAERPIGVFDSGVGGLTVVRAIEELLPQEHLVYFGDTARTPYGPRSVDEVRSFAFEIMDLMATQDVKMLVIACNAMTAAAYEEARDRYGLPVIGVIEPAVHSAVRATHNNRIGMIGTEATVKSGAYDRAVARTGKDVELLSRACPVFVEFVERGDTSSPELFDAARRYLAPLKRADVDTLILGCTHYPMLSGLIAEVIGRDVALISSAEETAKDVYAALLAGDLLASGSSTHEFVCTGDPGNFRAIAERFLSPSIPEVRSVVPGGFRAAVGER